MLYFFVALTAVALGYFVAWPLIQPPVAALEAAPLPAPAALAYRPTDEVERLHRALAEIDFDHTTGKTNDEDWRLARASIEATLGRLEAGGQERTRAAYELDFELEVHVARARHRLRRSSTKPV